MTIDRSPSMNDSETVAASLRFVVPPPRTSIPCLARPQLFEQLPGEPWPHAPSEPRSPMTASAHTPAGRHRAEGKRGNGRLKCDRFD